jgi:hypothetical protein
LAVQQRLGLLSDRRARVSFYYRFGIGPTRTLLDIDLSLPLNTVELASQGIHDELWTADVPAVVRVLPLDGDHADLAYNVSWSQLATGVDGVLWLIRRP